MARKGRWFRQGRLNAQASGCQVERGVGRRAGRLPQSNRALHRRILRCDGSRHGQQGHGRCIGREGCGRCRHLRRIAVAAGLMRHVRLRCLLHGGVHRCIVMAVADSGLCGLHGCGGRFGNTRCRTGRLQNEEGGKGDAPAGADGTHAFHAVEHSPGNVNAQ